jgi:endoglucanase
MAPRQHLVSLQLSALIGLLVLATQCAVPEMDPTFDPALARSDTGGQSPNSSVSDGGARDTGVSPGRDRNATTDGLLNPDEIPTTPGGCDTASGLGNHPFGAHSTTYAAGSILPEVSNINVLDETVRRFYDAWKDHYLKRGCGAQRAYIATRLDRSVTVSEAHGYGMIILALMAGHDENAQADFDGMLRYFWDHPSVGGQGLLAWSQDGNCQTNEGGSSATDGDLDIAYALLLADKQWGSDGEFDYFSQAHVVLNEILIREVDESRSYVLLGDWVDRNSGYYDATRSSDFMPGHLASFHHVDSGNPWKQIQDRSYTIMQSVQSSAGLFPDFVVGASGNPRSAGPHFLEGPYDGEYSYNACRVPLRTAVHFLTDGDSRARDLASRIATWSETKSGGDPSRLTAGYWLDGDSLPGSEYSSMSFIGPIGVAAMVDAAYQDWLNAIWNEMASTPIQYVYFDDTLKLISMIVMSGNWWSPERAPCVE